MLAGARVGLLSAPGAKRTGRRQPERAERRTKRCDTDSDQKGYLRTPTG